MKKDEYIKIRISKKDKEKLIKLSNKENETLSSYILRKSLDQKSVSSYTFPYFTPFEIQLRTFVSEVYHEINKSDNEVLKRNVIAICNNYLLTQRLRGK